MKRTTMLVLAVTLHNIPEGMAVGVVLAGWIAGNEMISVTSALALSIGIAMLYLAMMDITRKWTGRRQDWNMIHAQLAIFFADRMPD